VKPENIFSDFLSGKDFDRLQYKRLKEEVAAGDELYIKSIDRLGRNKDGIKEELQWFKRRGVHVHILDFPQTLIAVEDERQKSVMDLVTNLLIEVVGFMAEEERAMIRARQAEGIAAWRRTGQTKTGRAYGRPRIEVSDRQWNKVMTLLAEKRIKTKEAWKILGIAKNTYYRLMRRRAQEKES
jgi:DNA invertase Pin-like site-specific DNA recombinase